MAEAGSARSTLSTTCRASYVVVRCPYNAHMRRLVAGLLAAVVSATSALAQTPQPFPRPGAPPQQQPPAPAPTPQSPRTADATGPQSDLGTPTDASLGFPIYPTAQFIASYDAGRGQRYFIFGTTAPYVEIVAYYRTQLKERGDQVFQQPPTHMFEVGRFREETMAFPPGVTVKDWTWGGSAGYPNPKLGAEPARFATVIMIVPSPPASPQR